MKAGNVTGRLSHKKLIFQLIIGVIIAVGVMFLRGISSADIIGVMRILSDSFFVAGVLFLGIGGLKKLKRLGAFDMLSYSFSLLISTLGFRERRYNSYLEFVAREKGGERNCLYISGLILLSLALTFLAMYYLL